MSAFFGDDFPSPAARMDSQSSIASTGSNLSDSGKLLFARASFPRGAADAEGKEDADAGRGSSGGSGGAGGSGGYGRGGSGDSGSYGRGGSGGSVGSGGNGRGGSGGDHDSWRDNSGGSVGYTAILGGSEPRTPSGKQRAKDMEIKRTSSADFLEKVSAAEEAALSRQEALRRKYARARGGGGGSAVTPARNPSNAGARGPQRGGNGVSEGVGTHSGPSTLGACACTAYVMRHGTQTIQHVERIGTVWKSIQGLQPYAVTVREMDDVAIRPHRTRVRVESHASAKAGAKPREQRGATEVRQRTRGARLLVVAPAATLERERP